MSVFGPGTAERLKAARIGRASDRLVLLGAGSSVEAGIPDGKGLADRLVATGTVPTLKGLLPRLTEERGYPDVERAFSVLEAIADLARTASFLADLERAGITKPRNALIADPARAQSELELIVETLRAQLWLADGLGIKISAALQGDKWEPRPESRYLTPLVKASLGGTIATLNYDNVVEQAGGLSVLVREEKTKRILVPAERGGKARLLKLHGSLDWQRVDDDVIDGGRPREAVHYIPAVIFGAANKLRHYGPFLDLLRAFVSKLASVHHLVVIGYGFRDQHINEAVRIWATSDADDGERKRMTICQGPRVDRLPPMVQRWAVHDRLHVDPPMSMPASSCRSSTRSTSSWTARARNTAVTRSRSPVCRRSPRAIARS